jgi:hypothetical protein
MYKDHYDRLLVFLARLVLEHYDDDGGYNLAHEREHRCAQFRSLLLL